MPVLQILGDPPQIERNPQDQGIGESQPSLPTGQRLLENPPRTQRIPGRPMHGRQLMHRSENSRIVRPKRGLPLTDRLLQHGPRGTEVPGALQIPGMPLSGGQG